MTQRGRFLRTLCRLALAVSLHTLPIFAQTSTPGSRQISLTLNVIDDFGRQAGGIKREWITVTEKDVPLQITGFSQPKEPSSVVFAFDRSSSISPEARKAVAHAIYQVTETDNPANEYLVIAFSQTIKVVGDWSQDRQKLNLALGEVVPESKGNTALYDACDIALKSLASAKSPHRVLVLISDGQDNVSKLTLRQLRQALNENSVTVYSIGIFDSSVGSSLGMEGQAILDELAQVTGGKAFYPRKNKVFDTLDQIFLELRERYTVSFTPLSPAADNKWHAVKLKLKLPAQDENGKKYPRLSIRSRRGYYDR